MFGAAFGPFDAGDPAGDIAAELSGALAGGLAMVDEFATPPAPRGNDSSGSSMVSAGVSAGDGRDSRGNGDAQRGHGESFDRKRGGMPRFTEEIAARCLEVAAEVDSELAQRLLDARNRNPAEFEQQLRVGGFGRRLYALAQLKTHDPLLYRQKISELSQAVQIERKSKELRAAKADPDASLGDVHSLEMQLRTLLQIQLAMSIKARGDLLCKFNDRVAELQKELERDASSFQSIVDARMKMLTSESSTAASGDNAADAKPADAKPANDVPPVAVPAARG